MVLEMVGVELHQPGDQEVALEILAADAAPAVDIGDHPVARPAPSP